MSDVIGKGVIEVSADASKLKAGIDDAKRTVKGLGTAATESSTKASASIDRYIKKIEQQSTSLGKSTREVELHKLALRGATDAQLKAADSALKLSENYAKSEAMGQRVRTGLLTIGAAAVTGLIAAAAGFDALIKKAGDFQDMAEKTGDSAENIASLATAAGTAGLAMDTIVSASAKLTKGLTGVDDDSKAAGAALAALGLSVADFKNLKPADQMEAVAKALAGFEDGAQKSAVAMALFGKSGAEMMPFLKELGAEGGRQVILTGEQIRLADEYADKQAKLRAEITLNAQAIATQALPAINDFTGALSDAIKEMLSTGRESTSLAGNTGVKSFADAAAISIAELVDGIYNASGALLALKGSLNVIAADSEVVVRGASNAIASMGPDYIYKRNTAALEVAIKERENTLKDANARYARLSEGAGIADKVRARIAARPGQIATALGQDAKELARRGRPQKSLPELKYEGVPTKTPAGAAGKEAKAKLALDLEEIKNSYGSLIAVYANSEKIMEAMRSAGLVSDQDYYASKLGFLNLNSAAQEKDLELQIARMEQEKLIGKDRYENEKKIAEARAKLSGLKDANVTGGAVLSIQSEAVSSKKNIEVDKFFADAQIAADERNAYAVEGIRQSMLSQAQIETEAHALRIEQLTVFNASRLEGEASVNALIEDEKRRHEEAMYSIKTQSDEMTLGAASQATDQMYNLLKQAGQEQSALGKIAFIASKALAVAQIILSTNVAAAAALALPPIGLGPVAGLPLSGFIKAMGYASAGLTAGLAIADASAEGGYDIPAGVSPIVQAHPEEMILPRAQANVIRDLAKTGGGGDKPGAITIVNNTSAQIGKVTEQRMSNGERALIIEEAVAATAAQFGDPNSKTSRALSRNYATQRSR